MIYGIGTDIVRVERLAAMWQKHGERALDRLLAPAVKLPTETGVRL